MLTEHQMNLNRDLLEKEVITLLLLLNSVFNRFVAGVKALILAKHEPAIQ